MDANKGLDLHAGSNVVKRTEEWLQDLGICYPPFFEQVPAPWAVGCLHAATTNKAFGETSAKPKWRRFMLLVGKDVGLQQAIDTVVRSGSAAQVEVFVCEQLDLFLAKTASAPVIRAIERRQETRARRIQHRDSGFGGFKRPSDAEFLEEALPPKVNQ